MYKVLIPEEIDHAGWDYLEERGYQVIEGSGYDTETIKREIADVDAVLARGADYTRDVIAAGKKLKVIARHGVGVEHIDSKAAEEMGVQVANVLCANSNAVAEHTLMLMLMLAKYVPIFKNCIPQGQWDLRNRYLTHELQGKTLGIIGVGAVGIRTAKKAHYGLDMKILGYDPYIDYTKMPDYVEGLHSLEELFERSDVVTIHCPLNEETRYMVTPALLEKLGPKGYLINCARGGIVGEKDLYEALKNHVIAAAAVDSYETEPPSPELPLFSLDNFWGTPHHAGLSKKASMACATGAAKAIDDVLHGREPQYPVNHPKKKKEG